MTLAALPCRMCGSGPHEGARFCPDCGSALTAQEGASEYKQVTVLFADVVRSMDISTAVDIERLREIMTAVVERSAAVVQRFGGTVEYNGDGVMAIFGAPIALEDHAFRACVAALAIQNEMAALATEVQRRDGVVLQVRVGLNSGRVIAGQIGSGVLGYAATGQHVGLAQRMESAAQPGGVMLSESTARLVEHAVMLGEPQWVRVKGVDQAVCTRRLLGVRPPDGLGRRAEARLVGRRSEMAALEAFVDRAIGGRGGVATVVGAPGIGKSRTAREIANAAAGRGVEVFWAFCESHTSDVPFHAVAGLLRATTGVAELDGGVARVRIRERFPDADPEDLLLLDDLLGIADPAVAPPSIAADARRRRLTALINTASSARAKPALFIIEDTHWIDPVSESLIADFVAVIPQTPSAVLITYRPEYRGALTDVRQTQGIVLGPLGDSDSAALLGELLGSDSSVGELAAMIAERAAGNPFFAEEMVRELAQRGVLHGDSGDYKSYSEAAEVAVPETVQAAIEARIDRLDHGAKRTLNAASVIGARFNAELLAAVGVDAMLNELLTTELIDRVENTPGPEYAFRHPLIRTVAYEAQLKANRAQWHRRLATAVQTRNPDAVEENAALIAEHLEAAGELRAAYDWHMRAAAWSVNRDLLAARRSWERARQISDALPADDVNQLSMRIAPRTMLCATDIQAREVAESQARFAELEELCSAAGDNVSLAIGMSGPATELMFAGRSSEASRLSSEQMSLLESVDDPARVMGLAAIAFNNWHGACEFGEVLRWSQRIVDLAAGDPVMGAGYGVASPLAIALAWRGTARWCLGRPGWRLDLHDAVAMARRGNPETLSGAMAWGYGFAMQCGVLRADEAVLRASKDAVRAAYRASSDRAQGLAGYTLAVCLLKQDSVADRSRGLDLMMRIRDLWLRWRISFLVALADVWAARETARRGDRDAAIAVLRRAVGELRTGYPFYGAWATGVLVQTLLERRAEGDLAEAHEAIDWVVDLAAENRSAMLEIALLRLYTLLARARGDEPAYRDLLASYRRMAESLDFDGHIAWAEAMAEGHSQVG